MRRHARSSAAVPRLVPAREPLPPRRPPPTSSDDAVTAPLAREPLLIDLALQGGGSHGAFTWGVLDRLLEEEWLKIDGISGTSAGAMNAAVLAAGFAAERRRGARTALDVYWRRISESARFSPFQRGPLDRLLGRWTLDTSPMFVAMDLMSRLYSPYDLNPGGSNPLRGILEELIDFEHLKASPVRLFITATNVRTGRGRVFRNAEITRGRAAGFRLPADAVPGGGDRRRGLLGRRLCRQPDHDAAGARTGFRRHHPDPDQSGRAARHAALGRRHHEPPQRGVVQRHAAEGTAHDRAAAAGRRSRPQRRRPMGEDAHPHGPQQHHGYARLFVQAERRMGVPQHAARRGPALGAGLPRQGRRQARQGDPRSISTSCSKASEPWACSVSWSASAS